MRICGVSMIRKNKSQVWTHSRMVWEGSMDFLFCRICLMTACLLIRYEKFENTRKKILLASLEWGVMYCCAATYVWF